MATTRYRDVRKLLRSGDVGLVRTGNYLADFGRSDYSHAFKLAWRHSDQSTLLIAESREGRGGQVLTLSSQVRRFPFQIDIYRPNDDCPRLVRERAATIAVNWAGRGYGYPNLWKIWLAHKPWLRAIAEQCGATFPLNETVASPWDEPKICSQLVVWSDRWAKTELFHRLKPQERLWDGVPNLNDRFVEPGDIARSGSYHRFCEGLTIED